VLWELGYGVRFSLETSWILCAIKRFTKLCILHFYGTVNNAGLNGLVPRNKRHHLFLEELGMSLVSFFLQFVLTTSKDSHKDVQNALAAVDCLINGGRTTKSKWKWCAICHFFQEQKTSKKWYKYSESVFQKHIVKCIFVYDFFLVSKGHHYDNFFIKQNTEVAYSG
jgi:hypothetical protein